MTGRRSRLDLLTPAEKAIRDAVLEVEKLGASVLLTDAVHLLDQAREAVADEVDGIFPLRRLVHQVPVDRALDWHHLVPSQKTTPELVKLRDLINAELSGRVLGDVAKGVMIHLPPCGNT